MIVWDLDGTLVKTRTANLAAYESIGVTPPVDFHIRDWREWCPVKDYVRKGDIIAAYLRKYAQPTPLLDWYAQVGGTILTNASHKVVNALLDQFPQLSQHHTIHRGMTPDMKVQWLADYPPGIYLDDSQHTVDMVRRSTTWCAIKVQF